MVFLDANVVLEIILRDRAKRVQVENYLSLVSEPTAISILSVHLIMYFGRKAKAKDEFLEEAIGQNELLDLLPEDYKWALKNEPRKDFEDALQVAVAIRTGCEKFVTLDDKLGKAYANFPISMIAI